MAPGTDKQSLSVAPQAASGTEAARGGKAAFDTHRARRLESMNPLKRSMLGCFKLALRAGNRVMLDMRVEGHRAVPPGPKIYACNHISSLDGFHILPYLQGPAHLVLGPGYQSPFVARLLDAFEQVNALTIGQDAMVEQAAAYLRKGESILIAPEGDIQPPSRLGRFYPGVAKIYRAAPAPIIPIAVVAPRNSLREWPRFHTEVDGRVYKMVLVHRGPYGLRFGAPWRPEIDETSQARWAVQTTRSLRERIEALAGEIRSQESWPADEPQPEK